MIFFLGDVHGRFQQVIEAVRRDKPDSAQASQHDLQVGLVAPGNPCADILVSHEAPRLSPLWLRSD